MRIGLFVDTQNFGGAESIVLSLAAQLKRLSHQPILYHFGNDYLEQACHQSAIETRRVPNWDLYKRTYKTLLFARPFAKLLRSDRIDLLHSHLSGAIFAGGVACRLAGLPHVGTLHDVYVIQDRPIRAKLLKIVDWLGTTLVCVSEQMAEYYADVMRVPLAKLVVVRNGVDLALYRQERGSQDRDSSPVLMTVSRLDAVKRHDLLFAALAKLPKSLSWKLAIAGDGPMHESLTALRESLGLVDRIEFLGQRHDVPDLLAGADVFLLVSDSEGMSLSLIEAVASHLPIVATRVGNNSELVRDGWNGFLIEPGDVAALEQALAKVLADSLLRERFGKNSEKLSDSSLDFGTTVSAYLRIYERAVEA